MADSQYIPTPKPKSIKGSTTVASSYAKELKDTLITKTVSKISSVSPESVRSTDKHQQASNNSPRANVADQLPEHQKPKVSSILKPARAVKSLYPPMLNMVLDALKHNTSVKGLTLQGIKSFITEKYPDTKESFSNARLRNAISKGLESKEIIRPKSSEETGMKGYFLLNRVLHSQKEKVKQQKTKEKKSAPIDDKQPQKKATKVAKKKTSKTSDPEEPVASKSKTSKKKSPKISSLKKARATKTKLTESQPSTSVKKDLEAKPELSVPKKTVKKATTTSKSQTPKASKSKTSKVSKSHTPKAVFQTPKATPKLSMAAKAGARQKTAAIKKLLKTTE